MIDNIKIYKAINKGSIGMRVMIPRIQTELLQNGYIMFDRVKMQIRIGTIADQKPYKLTKLNKQGDYGFVITLKDIDNLDEYLGEYELEEIGKSGVFQLYKI